MSGLVSSRFGVMWMALAAFLCLIGGSLATERVVFLILVVPPAQSARDGIESWAQRFGLGLEGLVDAAEIEGGQTKHAQIRVRREEVPDPVSRSDLMAWWRSAHTLQAIAAVAVQDKSTTIIDNNIYLGDLKGPMPQPFLQITQLVEPRSYRVSRDALTIVTLYARAMDIGKNLQPGANQRVVCALLEKANLYTGGLSKQIRGELSPLLRALKESLDFRQCGAVS